MKKIKVSDNCIACGTCFSISNLVVENEEGRAIPNVKVGVTGDNEENAKKIVEACPVGAISIVQGGMTSQTARDGINDIKNKAIQKLKSWEKMKEIKKSEVKFDIDEFASPYIFPDGEYRYIYKSYDKAEKAGLDMLNKLVYRQVDVLMQQIIVEYKVKYLQKYYTMETSQSYFTTRNKKIEQFLHEVKTEMEVASSGAVQLPSGFTSFDAYPDFSRNGLCYGLDKHNVFNDEIIGMAKREFNSCDYTKLKDYACYFDIDEMEEYIGSGFFGDKVQVMYGYYNLQEAIDEVIKDIRSAMKFTDIDERAEYLLKTIVREYNDSCEKLLKEKIGILERI